MTSTIRTLLEGKGNGDDKHRSLADFRRPVGDHRAFTAAATLSSAGLPSTACRESPSDGRDLLCPADGLSVERPERHGDLHEFISAPPLPGMGGRRGLRAALGGLPPGLRRPGRHRLALASPGRRDDESTAGAGEKLVPIRPTAPSGGPNAVCWSMARACRWAWSSMGPIGPITSWRR